MPPMRGRKRSNDNAPPFGRLKRLRTQSQGSRQPFVREASPSKNVHFPRNLVIGPNESDPNQRSESPVRSALHHREDTLASPGTQLEAENAAAQPTTAEKKMTKKKRTVQPNVKTRKAAKNIQSPLKTPLDTNLDFDTYDSLSFGLIVTHDDVCSHLENLKAAVKAFAESFPANKHVDAVSPLLKPENKQLVRYIGCLAIGGKSGREGWRALLSDTTCRQALVFGIVGRALKEEVFDDLCFGADQKLNEILSDKEKNYVQRDGFFRTRDRADTILKYEEEMITTSTLGISVASVAAQLERVLLPLWKQGSTVSAWRNTQKRVELAGIVAYATIASMGMRKDRDTVYYWPPTFKDEEFEPERMEVYNLDGMITNSPYDNKIKDGVQRAVIRKGHEHEDTAVVRVVCFPGVVAYQQGGGALAKRELEEENHRSDNEPPDVRRNRKILGSHGRDPLTGAEGFRTRVLCKAVVLLQWGKQTMLTREAGTSVHMDAMERGDQKHERDYEGVVELYDLFNEEVFQSKSSLKPSGPKSPGQSWLPNVSRLFSRSPSLSTGDTTTI